ncbi:SGNH/GDSL hydrolase family protein [Pacificibacter marinus]|uniref:SGNH hydrolase-type esterase domain-containing protein n=1 Tax=Pacificibacter marinus TaxID=658057 RepID=A0A1Y5TEC2_9RHOB|nr:SGNH/GDSL hydrolase family protein [Pacificibacter marinus]SEL14244.1 Lysophospholipase L1 [Pacificibacter marinus]SLN61952.1 hypothetical protein PAM7971_03206 [Pacificibacter marinus]
MRTILLSLCLCFAALSLPSAVLADEAGKPKILAIGDSLMAWHAVSGRSIADTVGRALGEPVINRAVGGAKIIHALPISGALGFKIAAQYASALSQTSPEWVILTGGGNDLFLGCGCSYCNKRMTRMVDPSGQSGEIPKLISTIRKTGARVIYIGYLRSPGVDSIIDACLPYGNAFEARLAIMAAKDKGVFFVSVADMVATGDRSMHGVDMIHPSIKASNLIGQRVAKVIQKADRTR